jgi:amidase
MMRRLGVLVSCLFLVMSCAASAMAQAVTEWSGKWIITASFATGASSSEMTLTHEADTIAGASGPLDENRYFPLSVRGGLKKGVADLEMLRGTTLVGRLSLRLRNGALSGNGTLYGAPVTISAVRPPGPNEAPQVHDFKPASFVIQFSARNPPVLRIKPGDTVRTFTLDNEGRDAALQYRGMPGNTLTGPFWIEGAMPGDTLVVKLNKVELNRDTASMYGSAISEKALLGGYAQTPTPGWGRIWLLDRQKGVARPEKPGDRLAALELPLKPMVGSIGVAPPLNQSLFAGDLGFHGGNLDYSRVTTGATIYLPVWQAGAYFALGDGHALQGDGELSGQGLETSLNVEFTVDLIKGDALGQPWMEDADYVMVSGIDNGLDMSLQRATTGLALWLKKNYALNDSEIATLLSASMEYDIAEVVDSRPHVVAKLAKKTLAMLKKS